MPFYAQLPDHKFWAKEELVQAMRLHVQKLVENRSLRVGERDALYMEIDRIVEFLGVRSAPASPTAIYDFKVKKK